MDPMIAAAARALAGGAPLDALNHLAARDDAPALALRGSALAQIGELEHARRLLQRAAKASHADSPERARCVVALADVALAARHLDHDTTTLAAACEVLARHGDMLNAVHGRLLAARRLTLIGRADAARQILDALDTARLPPAWRAMRSLVRAELALRAFEPALTERALDQARRDAHAAGIATLTREIEAARRLLALPMALLRDGAAPRPVTLAQLVQVRQGRWLVDACRLAVHTRDTTVALATRPVLFSLVRTLAEAWPAVVPREALIQRAFRIRDADDTLRARLRVELGRLRPLLPGAARIEASGAGYALRLAPAQRAAVLTWPGNERHGAVQALLADGQAWSSSALALALSTSQRSVQRALDALAAEGLALPYGRGRTRRWRIAPLPGFAPRLLLPPVTPPQ